MEIPGHKKRFVLIAALDVYSRALASAKKGSETAHCSTADIDEKAIITEHLKAEYENADGQLTLDGTPMGEALTRNHYQDDDGTDLTADALDRWLRDTAGAYVPYAVIAEWVLEKRKLVAAWLRPIDTNVAEGLAQLTDGLPEGMELDPALRQGNIDAAQRIGRTCAPNFVDTSWFTPPTPIAEASLSTDDVEKWITAGPWEVQDYGATVQVPGDSSTGPDFILVKRDGSQEESKQVYGFDDARQVAAKRNRDLAATSTDAPAPGAVDANDSATDAPSTGPALVQDQATDAKPKTTKKKRGEALHPE